MNDESTRIIILLNKKSNLKPINSSISCATIIRFVVSATYKTKTNRRRIACLAWTNKSIDHIADMLQMICLHIFTIRGRKAAGGQPPRRGTQPPCQKIPGATPANTTLKFCKAFNFCLTTKAELSLGTWPWFMEGEFGQKCYWFVAPLCPLFVPLRSYLNAIFVRTH